MVEGMSTRWRMHESHMYTMGAQVRWVYMYSYKCTRYSEKNFKSLLSIIKMW